MNVQRPHHSTDRHAGRHATPFLTALALLSITLAAHASPPTDPPASPAARDAAPGAPRLLSAAAADHLGETILARFNIGDAPPANTPPQSGATTDPASSTPSPATPEPAWLAALGAAVTWRSSVVPGLCTITAARGLGELTLELLSADPATLFAVPDTLIEPAATPADPGFPQQSSVRRVCIESAWDVRTDASGLLIAVLDSGVDYFVEDLHPNIWQNPIESNGLPGVDDDYNGIIDDLRGAQFLQAFDELLTTPNDPAETFRVGAQTTTNDHGTPVASIIGAAANDGVGIAGVAWNCQILPVKIGGQYIFLSDAIAGLEYAHKAGAAIVNCSWGFSDSRSAIALETYMAATPDTLYVVASGNFNRDLEDTSRGKIYPAIYTLDNILCVGATNDDDQRWDDGPVGSNWGAQSVDLFAPGVRVTASSSRPWEPIARYTGTSFATPMVAGIAALVWAENPAMTPSDVRQHLINTATRLPALAGRCVSGGRVNAARALQTSCP